MGQICISLHVCALDWPDPARGFARQPQRSFFATLLHGRSTGRIRERVHPTTAEFALRYTFWALDRPDAARGARRRVNKLAFATFGRSTGRILREDCFSRAFAWSARL